MDNQLIIEYVNSNIKNIAAYVNSCFESSKDSIKESIIKVLKDTLTPIPVHYVLNYRGSHTELIEDGIIDINQTVKVFLEDEYTEEYRYSGYVTYGDRLSEYTIQIAETIMFPAIRKCIEDHFKIQLSDEDFELIRDECGSFDEIYDICLASEFYFFEKAVNFVKIGDLKLKEIIK